MPYKSLEAANKAIRGIDPPVTLAQANMIAEWADAMAANPPEKRPDNPWAAAIGQFKRLYVKGEKGWTRKATKSQEAFKTVDGKKRPASDFLVVPDRDKSSTWALPIKKNGKADHGLMQEAWEYEGPDKARVLAKLRALYKREAMDIPAEEANMGKEINENMTPGSVDDYLNKVRDAFRAQFRPPASPGQSVSMDYWISETFKDHPTFGTAVVAEYEDKYFLVPFVESDDGFTFEPTANWKEVVKTWVVVEAAEVAEVDFAESASGVAVSLNEAEATEAEPLVMDVCLIQPGWGNEKDNNYYPAEVLKRDAHRFVGAHQFEKDHTDDKSTRDWVSTIDSIVGETPEGGPIARVVVHDPNFAERMRLLDKAGLLKEMPCSILARGIAVEKEIDGKAGHQVEAITEVKAVDWVTAAGAGGHALAISENEEASMDDENKVTEDTEEEVAEVSGTEVVLAEDDAEPEATEPETEEPTADGEEETPEEDLSDDEVTEALKPLPAVARAKLGERKYKNTDELQEAIKAEQAYISDLTEAGKPFGHSTSKPKGTISMEEVQKRQDAANARALGTRVREVSDD